jgi:hypothetical protein
METFMRFGIVPALTAIACGASQASSVDSVWYYDTVERRLFLDSTGRVPPFLKSAGNSSVRAHIFSCGGCTYDEKFIGYYEKFTD